MQKFKNNELCFDDETNENVMNVICECFLRGTRIRVWYGDIVTGKSWDEENDTIGRVGKSTGNVKIPLLIKNKRSSGGGALLSNRIIKIVNMSTKKFCTNMKLFHNQNLTLHKILFFKMVNHGVFLPLIYVRKNVPNL